MYARAFSHATEDLEKVKLAVSNTVGPEGLEIRGAEGVHGNPISIVEATALDQDAITYFFSRLSDGDLQTLMNTLEKRVDEGCNLFLKIDKQSAFMGRVQLGSGDDVVSVRLRVAAFPATCDVAQRNAKEAIEQELAYRHDRGTQ